ncbi:hypothetical protein JAAARDRAFT_196684 [Jaapia argillacea MUCL 33604]|uniref:Fungal-type protein kinase domain-containing protein n=1 Tax=Jaapia argillacea MUCL 33604 TaxID=933084 RepID=A0A067PKE6_9AGAM|nr:hypothetical protein JAAARDRAFT_196684 [Jaapia argillacea MUCL 33604]
MQLIVEPSPPRMVGLEWYANYQLEDDTEPSRPQLCEDVVKHCVRRLVPVAEFMRKSFPNTPKAFNRISFPKDFLKKITATFAAVPLEGKECDMYKPLIDAMTKACSLIVGSKKRSIIFRNTANAGEEHNSRGTAADISVFSTRSSDRDWVLADAFVEVKGAVSQDPIRLDPKDQNKWTVEHPNVLAQFHKYSCEQQKARPRCFNFGIGIFGSMCRFFRWDRSVTVISERFEYTTSPELLADFLVRFDISSLSDRGIDETASRPITRAERSLVEAAYKDAVALRLVEDHPDPVGTSTRIFVPSVSGNLKDGEWLLSVGPPLFISRGLTGRGTRTWLAFRPECPDRKFVVVKDAWREEGLKPEGDIYKIICAVGGSEGSSSINEHPFGVARMDRDVDLAGESDDHVHRTIGPTFEQPKKYYQLVHHRSIIDSVGIRLDKFNSSRGLLTAIRDSIKGHLNMMRQNVLHRDVSASNILISSDSDAESSAHGFMIDPEYSAFLEDDANGDERKGLTGTFQFLAVDRIRNRNHPHQVWHDLESYFWVLLYIVLRHARTSTPSEQALAILGSDDAKSGFHWRIGSFVVHNNVPLTECLRRYSALISSRYFSPLEIEMLQMTADQYDLLDHESVLGVIDKALDQDGWPQTMRLSHSQLGTESRRERITALANRIIPVPSLPKPRSASVGRGVSPQLKSPM